MTKYVETLSISHKTPSAPKTCMDLVLRAERVYNLLGVPHSVATADRIVVIIKHLPPATASAIKIASLTNPTLITRFEELKKYVTLVDEQFKIELATRQTIYVPNRYNRTDGKHPHQKATRNKSAGT